MLTIKICTRDGFEVVKEVQSVMLRPATETRTGYPCVTYFPVSDPGSIPFYVDGSVSQAVDVEDGTVYVMNNNGKTVADYDLRRPEKSTG